MTKEELLAMNAELNKIKKQSFKDRWDIPGKQSGCPTFLCNFVACFLMFVAAFPKALEK